MVGPKFIGTLDRLLNQNRLLGFALVIMLLFNGMNWFSLQHAKESSRVTLVPISGGTGMWVGNGKASEEYLRAMARYVTDMLGNYSAGTYRSKLQELLLLFPPDTVGDVHNQFMHLADEVERYPSISSMVMWTSDKPLKIVGDLMQIHVLKTRLVNGSAVDQPLNSFYCVTYRIADTQFQLVSVQELSGAGEDLCLAKLTNETGEKFVNGDNNKNTAKPDGTAAAAPGTKQ